MSVPRLMTARDARVPTTAAIAPNAPIGATHMIIARMRNTSAWRCGSPRGSAALRSHPLQGEADEQRHEQHLQDVSIGERRQHRHRDDPEEELASWSSARAALVSYDSPVMLRPSPGWMRLPTTRPMPSAKVDMIMKYSSARPPTLPTVAAFAIDPTPSTIVQKMIGAIIILMSSTNARRSASSRPRTRERRVPP